MNDKNLTAFDLSYIMLQLHNANALAKICKENPTKENFKGYLKFLNDAISKCSVKEGRNSKIDSLLDNW